MQQLRYSSCTAVVRNDVAHAIQGSTRSMKSVGFDKLFIDTTVQRAKLCSFDAHLCVGLATWAGCGRHVEQALAGVPQDQRCKCR